MTISKNKSVHSAIIQGAAAAAILVISSAGLHAQQGNLVGLWQCEYAAQPISDPNLMTVYISFRMQLNADQTMQAQGVVNQQTEFNAEGQWQVGADGSFNAQGQMQDWLGVSPFGFGSRVTSGTTMDMQVVEGPNQVASQCQKSQ